MSNTSIFNADWILPITSPPIYKGSVVIQDNFIKDFGDSKQIETVWGGKHINFGNAVILPGFVNAHTHLNYSVMRGGKIKPGQSFVAWIKDAVTYYKERTVEEIEEGIQAGIDELVSTGTVAIGDITYDGRSIRYLQNSRLYAHVFFESRNFLNSEASLTFEKTIKQAGQFIPNKKIKIGLSPHAAYSVSPVLFNMVLQWSKKTKLKIMIHTAESHDEIRLLKTGKGDFRDFLESIGKWDKYWKVPHTSTIPYFDSMQLFNKDTIAVHAVQIDNDDINLLKKSDAHVCVCPRSNDWIKCGQPPLKKLIDAGIHISLGTDSLGSNSDLNMMNEMQAVLKWHPGVTKNEVLRMSTINGAIALGFENDIGSIDKGKRAALIKIFSPRSELITAYDFLGIEPLNIQRIS